MLKKVTVSGNVLFLILIAVALFGALSFVVTYTTNSSPGKIENEQQKLDQAVLNNCEADVNLALLRLENVFDCSGAEINYELPDGSNANVSAPVDDHCNVFHPLYGGAVPCGSYLDTICDLTTLNIGEDCDSIIYAGDDMGYRLYTSTADHSSGISWHNGVAFNIGTGVSSVSDGEGNTDLLTADPVISVNAGAPYLAAQLCRSYGDEWYLPAQNELEVLYTNRTLIGGFDESGAYPPGFYWTSTEYDNGDAMFKVFDAGGMSFHYGKSAVFSVRCVRKD